VAGGIWKMKMKFNYNLDPALTRRIIFILLGIVVLMSGISIYHTIDGIRKGKSNAKLASAPQVVSAINAEYQEWTPTIEAAASLRSTQGIDVTTELAGMVCEILFTPGQNIKKGDIIVRLNIEPDIAQLHVLEAARDLSKITYERDKLQYAAQGISKEQLDTDLANLKGAQAQVDEQQANINKKIIRAPFSGRLGISQVNLGQYLNPGDTIVTLQTMDPIWVDFFIPEQEITRLRVGQKVNLTTEAYPGRVFSGKVTSIDPKVDESTRNIKMEATFANPKAELYPGMFGAVELTTGAPNRYLTLPQAAISYNPYGDLVYLVKKNKAKQLIARQTFVTLGRKRGDQVAILKGIKEGDMVVTSGQLKIKNGTNLSINNSIVPSDNPNPHASDE
jgi:membrane fusion protein (multidrug efflux system)